MLPRKHVFPPSSLQRGSHHSGAKYGLFTANGLRLRASSWLGRLSNGQKLLIAFALGFVSFFLLSSLVGIIAWLRSWHSPEHGFTRLAGTSLGNIRRGDVSSVHSAGSPSHLRPTALQEEGGAEHAAGQQQLYKTIHTVYGLWDDGKPVPMADLQVWKDKHPDWQLVIHGKQESEALVAQHFPWLQGIYSKAKNIQRADLLRLLFVYHYGGLYIDVDVSCDKTMEEALGQAGFHPSQHSMVAFTETTYPSWLVAGEGRPLRNGIAEISTRVSNYIFYARPGSPALFHVLLTVAARLQRWQSMTQEQQQRAAGSDPDYTIIYTTGPDAVTEGVFAGPDVTLLPDVLLLSEGQAAAFGNKGANSWVGGASEANRKPAAGAEAAVGDSKGVQSASAASSAGLSSEASKEEKQEEEQEEEKGREQTRQASAGLQ